MSGALPLASPAWLTRYVERGFRLVFYPMRQKGPSGADAVGWPSRSDGPADYVEGQNVGIFTGHEITAGRFLVDVDLDWTEGIAMAPRLLPPTEFGFGRKSRNVSHAFYTTSLPQVSKAYEDIDGTMLVELRGTKTDGTVGLQTMAPPSVHPSGEVVELRKDGDIAHADELPRRVLLYAIACDLFKHLGKRGLFHSARMAVAGFLLGEGLAADEVIAILKAVAEVSQNDLKDVDPVVRSTATKLQNGDRSVAGRRALAKAIGDDGKKVTARIREWIRGEVPSNGVVMVGGQLSDIVDRAEAALLASTSIYQRGGILVRPVTLDVALGDPAKDTVRRSAGSTMLVAVREAWLLEQMGRALRWFRVNANDDHIPADPLPLYARTLLHRGEWRFPVLRGVVTAPTLAFDGRIIATPGFDAESGLLLDFPEGTFPPVPVSATKDDAHAALTRLGHPLRGFPFVDDAARSVALSSLLTALVRLSLRTAPLHALDAPTAGTGKSKCAEMPGLLATGCRPPALSQGKTAEEDEKRLSTVLFAGDSVIHLDNCERQIEGDFLCSLLSQEVVQARILGLSERRILPTTALVLASGNNLTFAGDVSRRAVICRLDAQVERPDTRVFDFDCHAEVLAARPELVVAGLTVLRAYRLAAPGVRLTPMGSFEDWEWIRGALVWLGCADPADTRVSILDNDPRKDELLVVLDLWARAFGSTPVEVADIERVESAGELRDKLIEVACRGMWSGKSVGWWLRRHKDRVVGGRCLRCDASGDGHRWRLARTTGGVRDLPFEGRA
ncbi:MAG: bifunctional DNA primase/polymerase [Vicinamibacterales bacterium]